MKYKLTISNCQEEDLLPQFYHYLQFSYFKGNFLSFTFSIIRWFIPYRASSHLIFLYALSVGNSVWETKRNAKIKFDCKKLESQHLNLESCNHAIYSHRKHAWGKILPIIVKKKIIYNNDLRYTREIFLSREAQRKVLLCDMGAIWTEEKKKKTFFVMLDECPILCQIFMTCIFKTK